MTGRTVARLVALVVALTTLAAATLAAPAQGTTEPRTPGLRKATGPAPTVTAPRADTTRVRTVRVKWHGDDRRPRYVKATDVPGIGTLQLVCRPDTTLVRLYAHERGAETQMWMSKFEVKNQRNVVAVKTARIYRYATAADDGTGGTGRAAHEGLNQRTPVENYSSGYARGLISQRPGRNRPAGDAVLTPATSFTLEWYWNGFDHPPAYRFCQMKMVLTTVLDEPLGIDWHGDTDADGRTVRTAAVAGLGDLTLTCETGRDGTRTVGLVPTSDDPDASVWVEYVTGEGAVEDHVEAWELDRDPITGEIGPLELPRNGMMRVFYTVDDTTRAFLLSSYLLTNNTKKPELNVCEVAAGRI
ncbi:hypothetical protein H5V45_08060 [Nocardioides sp. KIGAM211]|uniref:Uncharacterized protein n=1 Tax=Nocardioides luti TaxID=2761101 RepID=A0A7X0RHS2_9ACTN|nr:hypothetical protein [Nocardioides luti]MBB6627274.1 hypothetical protein [Nocardioides luti]